MDNIVFVKVIDCTQDFSDHAGCVLLCELSVFTNPVKELATSSQLGNDVIFVL